MSHLCTLMIDMRNLLYPLLYFIIGFGLTFILTFLLPNWITILLSIIVGFLFFVIGKNSLKQIDEQKFVLHILFGKFHELLNPGLQHVLFGFLDNSIIEYSKEYFSIETNFFLKHVSNESNEPFKYNLEINSLLTVAIIDPVSFFKWTGLKEFNPKQMRFDNSAWAKNIRAEVETVFRQISYYLEYSSLIENPNWTPSRLIQFLNDKNIENTLLKMLTQYGLDLKAINSEILMDKNTEKIIEDLFRAEKQHPVELQIAKTIADVKEIQDKKVANIMTDIIFQFQSKGISEKTSIELSNLIVKNYDKASLFKLAESDNDGLKNEVNKIASIWLDSLNKG